MTSRDFDRPIRDFDRQSRDFDRRGFERRVCDRGCQEAADIAVRKVFALLGVDVDQPESVEEFREDLRFGKRLRRVADRGTLAAVATVAVALMAALWAGILSKLGGH